jgi:hypothetical protein
MVHDKPELKFGKKEVFFFWGANTSELLSTSRVVQCQSTCGTQVYFSFFVVVSFDCKGFEFNFSWIIVSSLFPFQLKILKPCYMNCLKVFNFVLQNTVMDIFMTTPTSEAMEVNGQTSHHLITIFTLFC